MLTFERNTLGRVIKIHTGTPLRWTKRYIDRNDMIDMDFAEDIARECRELTGKLYLASDRGPHVSPRYDVIAAPTIGTPVSYAFNGDYYPCGEINYVTGGSAAVVRTTTGKTFRRRKKTSQWMLPGGTWSMVTGHNSRKNPHV